MRRIRSVNTRPELILRKLIWQLGFRGYRLHKTNLPGKPDIVFGRSHKIVMMNGCFWHQHTSLTCRISRIPRTNLHYWLPKFERTKQRDAEILHFLIAEGWSVLIVWECELDNIQELTSKLVEFLAE